MRTFSTRPRFVTPAAWLAVATLTFSCGHPDDDTQSPPPPSPPVVTAQPDDGVERAGRGTRITDAQLCSFTIGVTPAEEIWSILGSPERDERLDDGGLVLAYVFRNPATSTGETVTFVFDARRFLKSVSRATQLGQTTTVTVPGCFASPSPR